MTIGFQSTPICTVALAEEGALQDDPREAVLDPAVHLKGATPETLTEGAVPPDRAAIRPAFEKPVVGDEVAVEEPAADQKGEDFAVT